MLDWFNLSLFWLRLNLIGLGRVLILLRWLVSGSICGCGVLRLRILEKQTVWVVDGKPTSCELTQLLPLGRVGFRGEVVLA